MPIDPRTSSHQILAPRAGFWRRWLALMIDFVIVSLPFQIIGAILFVATSGWIQQPSGFAYTICETFHAVPDGLVPPPPAGADVARECSVYFFGAETARRMEVGQVTTQGKLTTIVTQNYLLDRDSHPINGVSIGGIELLALIVYLLAMETRTGATLGNLTMRIRVIDTAAPDHFGVPLRKIVFRYLIILIGFVPPILVLGLAYRLLNGGGFFGADASGISIWFLIAACLGWIIFLSVQVARKRDPLYDRIAGTAVVRV